MSIKRFFEIMHMLENLIEMEVPPSIVKNNPLSKSNALLHLILGVQILYFYFFLYLFHLQRRMVECMCLLHTSSSAYGKLENENHKTHFAAGIQKVVKTQQVYIRLISGLQFIILYVLLSVQIILVFHHLFIDLFFLSCLFYFSSCCCCCFFCFASIYK